VAFASLVLLAVPAQAAPPADAGRAVASYVAMEHAFFAPDTHVYRETYAWPVSQAVAATIAVAHIPGVRTDAGRFTDLGLRQLGLLRANGVYRSAADGAVYYDDNEWIARDLLDWRPASVPRAETIFAAIVGAWDADAATPCTGGVYWTADPGQGDRNTISTANGALVGLRLYALTRQPTYLDWSRRMLEWVDACMRSPDGLYWDHVASDGSVDRTEWTYNQGVLIGAYLALYRTTRDRSALTTAELLADTTVAAFDPARLAQEPPFFAAVLFNHLLDLAEVDGRSTYVAAAQAYATAAWDAARDPATGLFQFGGSTGLLVQAAYVQLYAHLAITESGVGASRPPRRAAAPTPRRSGG
jgi:hypothetical protein